MTGYSEMRSKLDNCQRFEGNSVTAKYNLIGQYEVISYQTCIFTYDIGKQQVVQFDNSYYSNTTSKIQNILIEVYKLNDGKTKRSVDQN